MLHSRLISAAFAAATVVGVGGCAFAEDGRGEFDGRQEIGAIMKAKTSLPQAISAAERRTAERAVCGLEWRDGVALYEIKVAGHGGPRRVLVDPNSGEVLKIMDMTMEGDERDADAWFDRDDD